MESVVSWMRQFIMTYEMQKLVQGQKRGERLQAAAAAGRISSMETPQLATPVDDVSLAFPSLTDAQPAVVAAAAVDDFFLTGEIGVDQAAAAVGVGDGTQANPATNPTRLPGIGLTAVQYERKTAVDAKSRKQQIHEKPKKQAARAAGAVPLDPMPVFPIKRRQLRAPPPQESRFRKLDNGAPKRHHPPFYRAEPAEEDVASPVVTPTKERVSKIAAAFDAELAKDDVPEFDAKPTKDDVAASAAAFEAVTKKLVCVSDEALNCMISKTMPHDQVVAAKEQISSFGQAFVTVGNVLVRGTPERDSEQQHASATKSESQQKHPDPPPPDDDALLAPSFIPESPLISGMSTPPFAIQPPDSPARGPGVGTPVPLSLSLSPVSIGVRTVAKDGEFRSVPKTGGQSARSSPFLGLAASLDRASGKTPPVDTVSSSPSSFPVAATPKPNKQLAKPDTGVDKKPTAKPEMNVGKLAACADVSLPPPKKKRGSKRKTMSDEEVMNLLVVTNQEAIKNGKLLSNGHIRPRFKTREERNLGRAFFHVDDLVLPKNNHNKTEEKLKTQDEEKETADSTGVAATEKRRRPLRRVRQKQR